MFLPTKVTYLGTRGIRFFVLFTKEWTVTVRSGSHKKPVSSLLHCTLGISNIPVFVTIASHNSGFKAHVVLHFSGLPPLLHLQVAQCRFLNRSTWSKLNYNINTEECNWYSAFNLLPISVVMNSQSYRQSFMLSLC